MLPDIVPEVGKAVWNGLRLGCSDGSVRIRAMIKDEAGNNVSEAPDGTQALNNLFDSLPAEVGGFYGCLSQNYQQLLFTGMCAVEAIPGARNSGVAQIWPIDTLTLKFRRDPDTNLLGLWQKTRVYTTPNSRNIWHGFTPLPMDRTFWSSIDGFAGDPYGRPPMATVLFPVLEMIAFIKDLLLAWHRVGTPKWDVGFDYEMWARVAREQLGLSDRVEIQNYLEEERTKTVAEFSDLNADDAFFHDINSKVSVNGSGGQWPTVVDIYNILRWRMITGLKEMPTLMGVVEGNTETWSSVDWQIYAKGLQTGVCKAGYPLIEAGKLHLRLLGMPYAVEAEYEPIRANQRMVDAQAEQIEIDNEKNKVLCGWQTNDDASLRITGSKSVAEMDKEALGLLKPVQPNNQNNSGAKRPTGTKGPSKGN